MLSSALEAYVDGDLELIKLETYKFTQPIDGISVVSKGDGDRLLLSDDALLASASHGALRGLDAEDET